MNALKQNEHTDIAKSRRYRTSSLPTNSLFHHSRTGHVRVSMISSKDTPSTLKSLYTSQASRAYRRRRCLHHKKLREKATEKKEQEEIIDKPKPLDQFRRIVKLVITLRKAFKNIVSYASEKGRHEQINSETTLNLKSTAAMKSTVENLLFDPEDYKCHYQSTLPTWAKHLAEKVPDMRTPEEVKMLVRLMKQLKAFRRYSPEMQYAIGKALRYDSFSRRRVVIRKGQVAQRFYFIFSGSVCITVDDDETSAFAKPTENSVLKRGDFFGELAFLRNLRRSATIVCLEKTEFLSVDKQDFFSADIDKCFYRDMERRVDFFSHHPLFTTWPKEVVRELAEVSRINEYHTEEVLVRDVTNSNWLVLVTKGQCDILRLLDLSSCAEYVSHCNKYRNASINDITPTSYSPNFDRFSPNSLLIKGFPVEEEENLDIPSSLSENRLQKKRLSNFPQEKQSRTKSAVPTTTKQTRMKHTPRGRSVTFSAVGSSWGGVSASTHNTSRTRDHRTAVSNAVNGESGIAEGVGVGVYMVLDRLRPGQCFGAWSILQHEETKTKASKSVPLLRRFTLISGGCEVIKVSKDGFMKHADPETLAQLRKMTREYPSDSKLCHTYLKHSDWRTYREELVDNLIVRHISRQEAAKGSWRTHAVRASPVPSPLCTMQPWQPVKSTWEYFPRTGWVPSNAAEPVIDYGYNKRAK